MKRWMTTVALSAVALVAVTALGMAQEGMPEMGAPDEMKMLAKMDGKWDVAMKYRMAPDQDWTESQATAELSTKLDGCTQLMTYKGEMMGMPMHGMGMTSYDRYNKEWQSTWVDNMTGRISYYTGPMKDGKMVQEGMEAGPGGMKVHVRMTTYDMTDDSYKWMMEQSMDGETYFTALEAVYTRAE